MPLYFYLNRTNKITTEDVILMTSFLHAQTTVEYSELPDVSSDILTYFSLNDLQTQGFCIDTQVKIVNSI